jgi:hypothetical protein
MYLYNVPSMMFTGLMKSIRLIDEGLRILVWIYYGVVLCLRFSGTIIIRAWTKFNLRVDLSTCWTV